MSPPCHAVAWKSQQRALGGLQIAAGIFGQSQQARWPGCAGSTSSSAASASAWRACAIVPGMSPSANAASRRGPRRSQRAARDIPLRPPRPSGRRPQVSDRSSVRRRATTTRWPPFRRRSAAPTHSPGRAPGERGSRRRATAAPTAATPPIDRLISIASQTRSIRFAARSMSWAGSACWMASAGRSFCSYHALARRCSSGTRSAARRSGARAAHRRRGGDSDTTGGCRRAERRTGCPAPAPPARLRHPSCPVTASHSGPFKRSRIEVCSRKARTCSGWRRSTSSTR